jgi:hypothetical protein
MARVDTQKIVVKPPRRATRRTRVQTQLNPPYESGDDADRGQEVTRQPVVARGDTPEVFQSAEGVLDAASFFVEAPVEAEWLLSVAAVGNDWLGSAIVQPQSQLGAVVGLVGDQAFRCFAYGDEPLRDRAVMRFAAGQEDGEKTAPSICACMDLCVAPASRAANCLLLLPPFPPAAERCALICVESIICVFAELPVPASFRNRFSQIPRRAQRTKRL